jgi:hypothetical protein
MEVQLHTFLTWALNIGECEALMLGWFTAEEDYPVTVEYEAV